MRRISLVILALVAIAVLTISCTAETDDSTTTITLSESATRAMSVSIPDFDSDSYIWYYTAEKENSGTPSYGEIETDKIILVGEDGKLANSVGSFPLGYYSTLYGFAETNAKGEESTIPTSKSSSTGVIYTGSSEKAPIEKKANGNNKTIPVTIENTQTGTNSGAIVVSKDIKLQDKDVNTYKDSSSNDIAVSSVAYRKVGGSTTSTIGTSREFKWHGYIWNSWCS